MGVIVWFVDVIWLGCSRCVLVGCLFVVGEFGELYEI